MAMFEDQQSNFKYFCKICKKGFGCGRALGGHMRAHGIGDESEQIDEEDDPPSDWEDKTGGGNNVPSTNTKCMYALRTNPNRLKTCRNCENCGKEFMSWKSFLEHGKCSSSVDAADSLVSSPDYEDDRRGCSGWSKRKRSLRAKVGTFGNSHCPSSEEEDLANCLMMLSNATVDPMEAEPEESCASASKEEERIRNPMNNYMAPVSRGMAVENNKAKGVANSKGLFECKACKKVFNSHQALGGHRASHKKVKGCFAARLDHLEDSMADDDVITHEEFFPSKPNSSLQFDHGSSTPSSAYTSKRKSKVHECSICHRIFSSGQALGGHKRCHWITSNAAPDSSTLAKFYEFQESMEQQIMNQQRPKFDSSTSDPLDLKLDLNLPAPTTDENGGGGRGDRPITNPNPSSLEVSTDFFLQSWVGTKEEENPHHLHHSDNQVDKDNNIINNDECNVNNHNNSSGSMQNLVDEADSKVKLAKLSELKDINTSGSSSPWLQVGLGSTTNVAADP
ncbi:zinc finger protein ZAT9-like [Argentina anserina]|uniref:zinc finger protein ZAT9-like n=1 Tax=Argentina anserina TaxID=57926 RepID=UPI00217688C5|nr:zinc finger protein ZAT9-like [Potentilla anserina]